MIPQAVSHTESKGVITKEAPVGERHTIVRLLVSALQGLVCTRGSVLQAGRDFQDCMLKARARS